MQHTSAQTSKLRAGFRSGFTLIELLVVIAIISLLIAILLPSLENARKQAKRAACMSSIKAIATTSRVYEADDEQGWGIPVHPMQRFCGDGELMDPENVCTTPLYVGAYEFGGKSGIGRQGWPFSNYPIPELTSRYGTANGFGPGTRPMNKLLYGSMPNFGKFPPDGSLLDNNRTQATADTKLNLDVFKCPGDDGPPRGGHCNDWVSEGNGISSYDWFGTSYSANIFMIGSTAGGQQQTNSPYMRPVTRIPTPSRTIYYEENIGRWAWAAKTDICSFLPGVDVGPTKQLGGWHGQDWTYNRSFVDAHAEYQKIYIEGTEDSNGFANHYRNEVLSSYPLINDTMSPGCPQTTDEYTPLQIFCIIVRGQGWAKDTLPANLICTGIDHDGDGRPSYEDCVCEQGDCPGPL